MPIKGEIPQTGGGSDFFTLPDPEPGKMISGRLEVKPGVIRHIFWAPHHMIETGGAGKVYLKRERVGNALATANLPNRGATGILTDVDTGTTIHVTRE